MKNKNTLLAAVVGLVVMAASSFSSVKAQADTLAFTTGADFYSTYVWRGSKFGTGPAFQPSVKLTYGGLSAGVWGSFDAAGYQEVDPFISYALPVGLSIGVTDYYYGGDISKTDKVGGSHAFEGNLGFTKAGFSLSANYIFNEAQLETLADSITQIGAGSAGGDMYFQLGYAFKYFNVFVGAGDGWHTSTSDFAVCNVGIGTSKTIKITDSFSIPVTGQIIVNPEKKKLFLAVGFTL